VGGGLKLDIKLLEMLAELEMKSLAEMFCWWYTLGVQVMGRQKNF
jgi:hypothetical protein